MWTKLIDYTEQADARILAALLQAPDCTEKMVTLMSHVLNAQHVWASRILGLKPDFGPWTVHDKQTFIALSQQNIGLLKRVLAEIPLEETVQYTNSQGDTFVNRIDDILFHVINHSTYHRAQLASMLKLQDINPPVTDYIMLNRTKL